MKRQSELNQKNQALKLMSAELVKLLKGEAGRKMLNKTLVAMHGRTHGSYGDTGAARDRRIAADAQSDLIAALEDVAANARPHKQKVSEEKLDKIREKCREATGAFTYEIVVGGEPVVDFKADDMNKAKAFAKSLRLGKHEVKRLTRRERQNRHLAYVTSPESETYWSS